MTALIAATTVLAAAAAAPELAPLAPCYVVASQDVRQAVPVSGTGFTPGGLAAVSVDGGTPQRVVIGADGTLAEGRLPAPFIRRGERPFEVTATDEGTGYTASVESRVTRLAVRVTPKAAAPASRVRFRGSGFTADRPVFAHYVRGGVTRATARLAPRPSGPCGTFAVRRRLFPFVPQTGRWTLQVDQRRTSTARPGTAVLRLRVTVRDR